MCVCVCVHACARVYRRQWDAIILEVALAPVDFQQGPVLVQRLCFSFCQE